MSGGLVAVGGGRERHHYGDFPAVGVGETRVAWLEGFGLGDFELGWGTLAF
jgi:hypothetical protein